MLQDVENLEAERSIESGVEAQLDCVAVCFQLTFRPEQPMLEVPERRRRDRARDTARKVVHPSREHVEMTAVVVRNLMSEHVRRRIVTAQPFEQRTSDVHVRAWRRERGEARDSEHKR